MHNLNSNDQQYASVDDAVTAQELSYQRAQLKKELEEYFKADENQPNLVSGLTDKTDPSESLLEASEETPELDPLSEYRQWARDVMGSPNLQKKLIEFLEERSRYNLTEPEKD